MREKTGSKELAERIKELRKANNLTQLNLADKTGIAISTIQKIESAKHFGERETHERIAEALGVSLQFLLFGKEKVVGTGELTEGRFVTLPPHFTQEDHDFLMGVINFIAATYERGNVTTEPVNITGRLKEPEPLILGRVGDRMPDPWITTNEKYLVVHKEELRKWLEEQDKKAV